MADGENLEVDLFGDPCLPPREGRGRPAHVPTRATRNRVLLCFVRGLTVKDAAVSIGISVPTLREHYSSELHQRKTARLKMEMRGLELLVEQAEAGSVAANKELDKRIEKLRLRDQHEVRAPAPKAKARSKPVGKKEEQKIAAAGVTGRFEPRLPPSQLVN